MRKKKSIISVDKLTLCYRATDEVIAKLNEYNELVDSDDSFTLVRVPSDEALFANSFHVMVSFDGSGRTHQKKFATLKTKLRSMGDDKVNYVWLYIENWVFYEVFGVYDGSKCNCLACVDYIADELGLILNNITDLHIALDTNIDFAKKISKAQFDDDYIVVLNGTIRSNKDEILDDILHVKTGNQRRLKTLSLYVSPKKKDGLSLKIYDKKRELEKSNKNYIPQWNGLKNKNYRVELTIKNEHLKEFYQWKGEVIPNELLMATLASQSQSQDLLFDMLYYFSNRLLRFSYKGKGISIFQL